MRERNLEREKQWVMLVGNVSKLTQGQTLELRVDQVTCWMRAKNPPNLSSISAIHHQTHKPMRAESRPPLLLQVIARKAPVICPAAQCLQWWRPLIAEPKLREQELQGCWLARRLKWHNRSLAYSRHICWPCREISSMSTCLLLVRACVCDCE